MKILVIHGPNLNLLGKREVHLYGNVSLADINRKMKQVASENKFDLEAFQSNSEGDIIDKIHKAKGEVDYIIINAAAYTHTSLAIADAISAVEIPTIEVHISNVYKRESFRHKSFLSSVCVGQICGFGDNSYYLAIRAITDRINSKKED